jgi:hypothetical protein
MSEKWGPEVTFSALKGVIKEVLTDNRNRIIRNLPWTPEADPLQTSFLGSNGETLNNSPLL